MLAQSPVDTGDGSAKGGKIRFGNNSPTVVVHVCTSWVIPARGFLKYLVSQVASADATPRTALSSLLSVRSGARGGVLDGDDDA